MNLDGTIDRGGEITVPSLEDCIKHGLITDGRVDMPTPAAVTQIATDVEAAPLHRRWRVWEREQDGLRPLEVNVPGLLLAERLIWFRLEGPYAVSLARSAVRRARTRTAAYRLLSAQPHLINAVPSDSHLYELAKTEQRLANAGLGLTKLVGDDPVLLGAVEKGTKLIRAGVTLSELRKSDKEHAAKLVEDLVDLVPDSLKSGITGPGQVVFRDVERWNEDMWRSTTKGLDVVSKALDTGRVDRRRLHAVQNELKSLSRGPWTKQTPIDFVKKTAEEIPVLGKLLKAAWG